MRANITLTGNTATNYGGAITVFSDDSVLKVHNSILYGNIAGDGNQIAIPNVGVHAGVVTISYCDIEGGYPAVFNPDALEVPWYGNFDVDPNFVASGYWDNGNWVDGDYHLRSQAGRWNTNSQSLVLDDVTSSCIDAGNPGCLPGEEPIDENNVRINIGAYGGTVEASKTPAGWGLLADLTNNRAVEMSDFAGLAADWRRIGDELPGDLDRSGMTVNISDLVLFAGGWLEVRTIEGP